MVDLRTDQTYGPPDTHYLQPHNFDRYSFWKSISGLDNYNPSSSLASSTLHPVLMITFRLICNIIFPQYENTKVDVVELEILWCIITQENLPHLGFLIVQKLIKISRAQKIKIICGGLVTLISMHLSDHIL